MKKIIFVLMLIFTAALGVNAVSAAERTWCMGESEFTAFGSQTLSADTTVNGLTLGAGTEMEFSSPKIRNIMFNGSMYTKRYGSLNSGYIKFYANGDTDIHILARAKSNSDEVRVLTVYSPVYGEQSVEVSYTDDYVFKYRGSAGYLYLYTKGERIRIYSISAKDYHESEYAAPDEGESKEWEFSDYSPSSTTINMTENTTIAGLTIAATEEYPVSIVRNTEYSPYGDVKHAYLGFNGDGRWNSRYVTFPVPRNSDIYITARSGDGKSERKLMTLNKYYGIPDTDMESEYLTVNGSVNTYKISYYGEGEDFLLCPYNKNIRIYRILIVPRIKKTVEEKAWNISENSAFAAGYYENSVTDSLTLCKASVAQCNVNEYSKRIVLSSGVEGSASSIKFNISDSSLDRGSSVSRTISVSANTTVEGTLLVVMNSEKYVIGMAELTENIENYSFNYTGSFDEISVYTYYPQNKRCVTSYVYSVNNGVRSKILPDDVSRTVSVTSGQSYQYYFTVDNVSPNMYTYKVTYNPNALSVNYVGYGGKAGGYSKDGINIIRNQNGELFFTIEKDNNNWSGVAASVIFNAKSTGNTTISFIAEVNT